LTDESPVTDYSIEMSYIIEATGTGTDMQDLVSKIDDAAFGAMPIHCGDPECCPEPRGEHYVSGAYGSSTIKEGEYRFVEETAALVARIRAALVLIGDQDITPMGRRVLEKILDAEDDSVDDSGAVPPK
jgi:hypothetical protein